MAEAAGQVDPQQKVATTLQVKARELTDVAMVMGSGEFWGWAKGKASCLLL